MDKILTVSIAAYNVEKTIEECLDSFLPSRYFDDLEILVINDGSNDNTANIVSKYEKKYPDTIHLINKVNGGHGSTLNKSLELATGKFYKAVDGDDWVDTKELDKLCDWLKQTETDLVINASKWCYPNNPYEEHNEIGFKLHYEYTFEEMYLVHNENTRIFPMTAITILTDKLRQIGMYIKENCFYADNEFVAFCGMAADTISFDNSCAYQYRMGNSTQSVSPEGLYKHLEDYYYIFNDLADIFAKHVSIIAGNSKEKYFLKFLQNYYNCIYINMCDKIVNPDKDYLLVDNIQSLRQRHPEIICKLKLTSITAYLIAKNPAQFLPLMRCVRKTLIFRILRKVKHLLKEI